MPGKADLIVELADARNAKATRILSLTIFNSAPSAISLVVPAQTAAQIAGSGFRFFVTADAPALFAIEYTTNLSSWHPIGTLQYTAGQAEMIDTGATLSAPRSYRVRWP